MPAPDYDYTQEDEDGQQWDGESTSDVPFKSPDEYADELELPIAASEESVEDIEDSGFHQIEPGFRRLRVLKCEVMDRDEDGKPKTRTTVAFARGADGSLIKGPYDYYNIKVTYCLPPDENGRSRDNHTVSHFFASLCGNPTKRMELLYKEGVFKEEYVDVKNMRGSSSKELTQFLHRLGFSQDPVTHEFEKAAGSLRNWRLNPDGSPREVYATIEAGEPTERPVKDKDGREKKDSNGKVLTKTYTYNKIKKFSFRSVQEVDARAAETSAKASDTEADAAPGADPEAEPAKKKGSKKARA